MTDRTDAAPLDVEDCCGLDAAFCKPPRPTEQTPAAYRRSIRIATSTDLVSETSDDGRTVTVRLVQWDSPTLVRDRRGSEYVETFARGGLVVTTDDVFAEREHDGPFVGLLVAVEDREDGLYGDIRMSRSSIGTDCLADIEARILRAVSVDFLDQPVPAGAESVVRTSARLRRIAFTMTPALDAPILSVRSVPPTATTTTESETTEMTTETTAPAVEAPPAVDVEQRSTAVAPPAVAPPAVETSQRSTPQVSTRPRPVLARFDSLGHFARAAAFGEISGDELALYQRALADVLTTDTTGMIQEQWIAEVIDLARTYTPTVNAWRSRPLPSSGMSISQPVVETRPSVAKQATQKTEVSSTTVEIGTQQWPIDTYAGGNDVSIQLIRRADPDYLSELMRLYMRELAQGINAAAAASLVAASLVGSSGNAALEFTTAATFDELVIDASAAFMSSPIRRPAELMALSVDLWKALGKAKAEGRPLYPSVNPMNTNGTISATDTTGEISRISWYVEPDLGAGISAVIGVREAFVTALGPVGTMTADVPAKLGRDVAAYQEAAFGASDASGLVRVVNETP